MLLERVAATLTRVPARELFFSIAAGIGLLVELLLFSSHQKHNAQLRKHHLR